MKTKRILSIALTLVMLLGMLPGMNLTAYAANNLTIYIMDMLENMVDNEWGYQLYDGDVSIAEGTYVQINMGTWHTGVMNIYMNGEVVYTKPSGSLYKDDVYHFTAGPNCKILGGYQNMFDWDGNPNVYITQDASVAVTGVTLNPNTAQTIDVGGSVAFTATVEPAGASDKTVKWSVGGTNADAVKLYSDSACTTEVGADATDKLTVYAKGESAGSATVTATSNADSTKSASCDVTVNAAQTQTEELLTTITATGQEQANYSTANVATVSFSYTAYGSSAYTANWGWWGYGWTATVNAAEGYNITKCVFYDDANRTATDNEAPFVVETTEEDKTPKVNGTPILANTSKGIKKIEVYGYATPTATHSVTITAGDHMTKTAGSGDAEQTGLTGAMTDVVYTADNGYYYPTDYSVAEVSGIKVTRDSYTQITVSGTPTADAAIALTAPTAKTTPDAPTTANATDCTTADNNDGKLTGVTTAMEYKKSDAADWTAGTDSDITGLVPGTYYVRVKATDTTNASTNQELTIKGFISATVTFKVANGKWDDDTTADKTVTLTGHDGDTLKLAADQIPAVGTKPNDTYKAGSWDVTPSTETAITEATTYTYTYAAKEASVVTKAPEAKTLTYNGSAQELVTAGTATGGTMQYAFGTATEATQPYTTSIPTATEVGTYYVWYKVVGDANHNDTVPQSIPVEIRKTTVSPMVSIEGWIYGGTANTPSVTGNTGNGTVTYTYAVKGSEEYSAAVPTAAGEYTVKASIAATDNYLAGTATADFAIAKAAASVTTAPTAKTLTYNGQSQELVNEGSAAGGTMQYALGTDALTAPVDEAYKSTIPMAVNAGTYYVWYKAAGDENHTDSEPAMVTVSIEDKTAPTGEISIDTNKWTSFLNTITFGLFFKETKDVTIMADDTESGVQSIEYYIADAALTLEQVKDVTEWNTYDSAIKLNPENKYVVYAKITNKAGNITYISSNGLVFVNPPVGYVTDIGVDSAKLNMQLLASIHSEVKSAGFEYKKKADADTAWSKVEGTAASGTVTKELTSLAAGTDYVFRPYVTYTNDTTDTGAEQNFTTDMKPAVTGSIAVKVKNETDGTKDVIVTIEEGNYALASQEKDGIVAGEEVTTGKFKELPDGTYNIVIKSKDGEFVETKMITIADGAAEEITFLISKGEMKTDVEVEADTPKVAVDGLSKEELVQSGTITSAEKAKVESGEISLEVTLKAEKKEEAAYQTEEEKKAVEEIKDQMANSSTKLVVDMFLDLSLLKKVTHLFGDQAGKVDETDIGSANTKVLEIAVPYDTTIKGLMVYRYHDSAAMALKKLSSAPAKGAAYEDGSFYLSDKYIHIFASGFSTYAIAKEEESSSGGESAPITPGKPAKPVLKEKTQTSITVETVSGQVYSINGGVTWKTDGVFEGLTADTEYSIITKISATETTNESPSSDALVVKTDAKPDDTKPEKTTPARPAAPTLKSKDQTTITVVAVAGQQYSIDGGRTWQSSGTFTGLTPNTKYSIITKIAATDTANESPSSVALVVTTDQKTAAKTDKVTKAEKAAAKLGINAGLKVSQTGKKVTVKWGKVTNADRYEVYAAYCGPDKCTKIKTLSGSKTSMTFTKLNGSKLILKKNIKIYVVAYRKVNGKETKLAKSITAHVVGSKNAKYTNVKKIKLSKSKYTLKAKQTAKIKAKVVLVDKKKKKLSDSHVPKFRYASGNTKVAKVDKNGKIKAVGKGTCYVYVYAANGYAKKVKVTVN